MHPEHAEEGQQDPGDVVVGIAGGEAQVRLAIHRGDQKQVDDPADEQQTEGEEPDGAGHRLAVIETVRTEKTEDPQQVADQLAVGVLSLHGELLERDAAMTLRAE